MSRLAGDQFDTGDGFVLGLVGEHRAVGHVAHHPHAGGAGLEVVRGDKASSVWRDADGGEIEAFSVGATANSQQHNFGVLRLGRTARHGFIGQGHAELGRPRAGDLLAHLENHALLGQRPLERHGDLGVRAGDGPVEILDDGDFGAQAAPDRAEFQTDDPGADDDHALGHGGQGEGACGVDDAPLIHLHAGQPRRLRARGDDDVLGGEGLLGPVVGAHDDLARAAEPTGALDPVDLVLLEQEFDALGQGRDAVVLLLLHLRQIEGNGGADAEVGEVLAGGFVEFGRMQQRLGGNTADIEAGAAQGPPLFNTGDRQAELTRADRRVVATRPAADDHHVVLLRHVARPSRYRAA